MNIISLHLQWLCHDELEVHKLDLQLSKDKWYLIAEPSISEDHTQKKSLYEKSQYYTNIYGQIKKNIADLLSKNHIDPISLDLPVLVISSYDDFGPIKKPDGLIKTGGITHTQTKTFGKKDIRENEEFNRLLVYEANPGLKEYIKKTNEIEVYKLLSTVPNFKIEDKKFFIGHDITKKNSIEEKMLGKLCNISVHTYHATLLID